jgi:hypothetical protein
MMGIIHESGWAAWLSLVLTLLGLVATFTIGRKRGRPGTVAAAFAVAILASGQLGVGTGQRKVDQYVQNLPKENLADKVEALSVGTREASANLLLSGVCSFWVSVIGGVAALVALRKKGDTA